MSNSRPVVFGPKAYTPCLRCDCLLLACEQNNTTFETRCLIDLSASGKNGEMRRDEIDHESHEILFCLGLSANRIENNFDCFSRSEPPINISSRGGIKARTSSNPCERCMHARYLLRPRWSRHSSLCAGPPPTDIAASGSSIRGSLGFLIVGKSTLASRIRNPVPGSTCGGDSAVQAIGGG